MEFAINLFDKQNGLEGFGPLGLEGGGADTAPTLFNKFLSGIIGIMTIIAFIWFIILVVTGALGIMTAGGDKNAVANGVKKITNGVIGIIVIIGALLLIRLITTLLGLESVPYFLDPGAFITKFTL